MAQIIATFDTKEKTLSVTVDGDEMENVEMVDMYKSYMGDGKYRVGITTVAQDEDNDVTTMTRMMATDESPELTTAAVEPPQDAEKTRASLQEDVSKYFQR